jgi:Protein of unknown function (DUF1588)/Protein of unknown function (DUF1587)/Protein of unknown function (DUF1585)/Protein of unknown function (DUF1592)/Protein of unknown function (DUF1595)/Planctomycete cytochrome C
MNLRLDRFLFGPVLARVAVAGFALGLNPVTAGAADGKKMPAGTPVAPSSKTATAGPADPALALFHQKISPILEEHCYECHGDGAKKAGVAFDELTTKEQLLNNPQFWLKVLRNTRSHVMPPPENPPPTPGQQQALEEWIKTGAFGLNPAQPDPGRVTLRRLNRTEYRNTLRDLLGIDFDAESALPPDDVGYGFDNIGDVMSISPMRMEKLIEAAMAAVNQGVPQDTVAISTQMALPTEFVTADGTQNGEHLSFYQVRKVSRKYHAKVAGDYRVHLAGKVDGEARPDPQKVRMRALSDDKEFFGQEYHWSDAEYFDDERVVHWEAGDHELSFTTEPLLDLPPLRTKMEYKILFVRLEGPLDRKQWEHPPGYARFYPRAAPPEDAAGRRAYAREVLGRFVPKAFRRPVSSEILDQLVTLAEKNYSLPGVPFEKGVAQAMVAVLASPRFLFHLETAEPIAPGQAYARIDEYTLASRLSYALWSSMPDEELVQLAARGELRKNFPAQVKRLIADPKAQAFAQNFSGQWLQSRGVLDLPINSAEVMAHEGVILPTPAVFALDNNAAAGAAAAGANLAAPAAERVGEGAAAPPAPALVAAVVASAPTPISAPAIAGVDGVPGGNLPASAPVGAPNALGGRGGRGLGGRGRGPLIPPGMTLTAEARAAMKQETETYFAHIVREDRSVLELLESDYTFVNETLAPFYGIPNVTGPEMRLVKLPPSDLRGGVLTMGSVLTVTSNPTRTSPVKRGKWILENILGAPPAPPPPNIPALEETKTKITDRKPTQRELLAQHREDPACASCHSRMDPLGLAMESFNAFGRGRTQEYGQPIQPSGELATGEKFSDVRDLKRALVEKHRIEFYRTMTEKLLTYTLGRGVEYYDVPTVDRIVERLEKENGRFSALLFGVLESAPFQQRRSAPHASSADAKPASLVQIFPSP